ncbi:MAG: type I asparaginase [Bacteroidaceae bacterium]|nr:type I asparaginase [Bacteroidaceae bacterium]
MSYQYRHTNQVLLIYTGGTIGMGANSLTGALEPLDFREFLREMPEFAAIPTKVDVYQFSPPVDSSDMNPSLWATLAKVVVENYDSYDGFVVLHGTDTMAFTASALSFMLRNLSKPVILTGSQLPVGQLRTDGKENLITSIELAADHYPDGRAKVPEVCIYFSGKLLRGNRSTKINADGFNAFDSFNYPHLADVGVSIRYHDHHILTPDYASPLRFCPQMDANVVVFTLFPGIQEGLVRHIFEAKELRGIILRTYGSGNAPQQPWLIRLLEKAGQNGLVVVNISQCAAGTVEMARYGCGTQLESAGVISGYDGTVESAVAKLMHLQALYSDPSRIRELMRQSLCGEVTIDY